MPAAQDIRSPRIAAHAGRAGRAATPAPHVGGSRMFWAAKAGFDYVGAFVLLPIMALLAVILLLANPRLNPGPLIYRQIRMGRHGVPFVAYKFRTMLASDVVRGPSDPLETRRITAFGKVLRRSGLDEVPQILNILRGEMSLIGPRPDCLSHAELFMRVIPDYRKRLAVRPGLSGLAQIELGYAEGVEATRDKVRADLRYLSRAGFRQEGFVFWRTIVTICTGRGDWPGRPARHRATRRTSAQTLRNDTMPSGSTRAAVNVPPYTAPVSTAILPASAKGSSNGWWPKATH